ncbi:MAG TPA: rhodanese-like domain-containing protein [Acidobacteriota bacterium]|nr:rhodanese-like domain-containing protein [Acidobacteriota bacterium]
MKEISAQEAYDLMQKDPEYMYLDVRSQHEFEQGHPMKAVNIPIMHFDPRMGMYPNDDFVPVAEAALPKDAKLIIGCKTGMRSASACEILGRLGYQNVVNVRGGFVGAMDNFGRVVEPGWSLLHLPICRNCEPGSSYDNLAARIKK